jgi:hypothetical protein
MAKATKDTAQKRGLVNLDEAISPAEHWRRLVAIWARQSGPTPDEHPGDTEAEASARKFLVELNQNNPDGIPGKTKHDLWDECEAKCDIRIPWRAFDRIWLATVGPAFRRRGPHRPRAK